MFCHQCSAQLPDSARFCLECGERLATAYESTNVTQPRQKKSDADFVLKVIGGAAVFILAFLLTGLSMGFLGTQTHSNSLASSTPPQPPLLVQPPPPPPPKETIDPIAKGSFVVAPGKYTCWDFEIVFENDTTRIVGKFQAEGGSGNDIRVMLLTAEGFLNWSNGHGCQNCSFYDSGKVTAGHIDVKVPEGKYYLIFSNIGAFFSNKVVKADINAISTTLVQ
jgi:zinc-ribbon domain